MFRRLRGLKSLVHDAVALTTDLIETGQQSTLGHVSRLLELLAPGQLPPGLADDLRRAASVVTLGPVRVVNRVVQQVTDAGIDLAATQASASARPAEARATPIPLRSDITGQRAWLADATLAALNGAVGDYLHREGNPLDLGFWLRHGDTYFPVSPVDGSEVPAPGARLALLVHGLGASEWSWNLGAAAALGDPGASFGTLLGQDLGYQPLFTRYNSGRHVAENGRLLADGLEAWMTRWAAAGTPVEELLLVGHSMGGLVLRSALRQARRQGHRWPARVSHLFCLGAPNQGAPLEKLGHALTQVLGAIDLPGTRVPAEILRRRSAGIQDLRDGRIVEEPEQLESALGQLEGDGLEGIAVHFASGTVTVDRQHLVGQLIGDTLVRVGSAEGPGGKAAGAQASVDTACFGGVLHHELQVNPHVYAWIKRLLSPA